MRIRRFIPAILIAIVVFMATNLKAQNIASPDAPMFIKSTYAPLGFYAPDAVTPIFLSLNPAGLSFAKKDAKTNTGYTYDYLLISPQCGPSIHSHIASAYFSLGDIDVRISGYNINSTTRTALASQGLTVKARGRALEVVVSKSNDVASCGIAFLPYDSSSISIGRGLISGKADAKGELRAGFIYYPNKKWSIGTVICYENDSAYCDTAPELTGLTVIARQTGNYRILTGATGCSYSPTLGTILTANYTYQEVRGSADGVRFVRIPSFGATQFLSPNLGLNLSWVDSAKSVSIFYNDKNWQISGGYTIDTFRSVSDIVGKSDLVWISIGWGK